MHIGPFAMHFHLTPRDVDLLTQEETEILIAGWQGIRDAASKPGSRPLQPGEVRVEV